MPDCHINVFRYITAFLRELLKYVNDNKLGAKMLGKFYFRFSVYSNPSLLYIFVKERPQTMNAAYKDFQQFCYDSETISFRFWNDFATILKRFCSDFETILLRLWNDDFCIIPKFHVDIWLILLQICQFLNSMLKSNLINGWLVNLIFPRTTLCIWKGKPQMEYLWKWVMFLSYFSSVSTACKHNMPSACMHIHLLIKYYFPGCIYHL